MGYNLSTSLTHFSTIPATLRYGASESSQRHQIAELSAGSDVWELMRWPSRKPTLEEIYWVAGLFEGEGTFNASQVRITQKHREILDRVKRLVGGRVVCYMRRSQLTPTSSPMWEWYASGPRGRGIARTLYHLLSSRRQAQARRFLRISHFEEPPQLDPSDPTRLLWDWAPEEELD